MKECLDDSYHITCFLSDTVGFKLQAAIIHLAWQTDGTPSIALSTYPAGSLKGWMAVTAAVLLACGCVEAKLGVNAFGMSCSSSVRISAERRSTFTVIFPAGIFGSP